MADFTERQILPGGFRSSRNFNIDRDLDYIEVQKNGKTERIYGTQEQLDQYKSRKPDGTDVDKTNTGEPPSPEQIQQANAILSSFINPPGSTREIDSSGQAEQIETDPIKQSQDTALPGLQRNSLEEFASYNCLWTMACLTAEQYNNPDLYRTKDFSFADDFFLNDVTGQINETSVVFSSAGRLDDQRAKIFYGNNSVYSPEFYINDFRMKTVMTANPRIGNTSAVNFEFKIHEPYSMGKLLESMQVAAETAGYVSYLDNAPYVLRLDVVGFDLDGKPKGVVEPKFFVMKLTNAKFEVNEGGSVYNVTGIPFNHSAYSDVINTTYSDVALEAGKKGTLREVLQDGENSLAKFLNDNEKRLVDLGEIGVADEYEFQFPKNSGEFARANSVLNADSATSDINQPRQKTVRGKGYRVRTDFVNNPIGSSDFGFDVTTGGRYDFPRNSDVRDEEGRVIRDKMTIDPSKRVFQFAQGQTITDIIGQLVRSTTYAEKAIDERNLDELGFANWYRIDVQVQLTDFDSKVADYARKITFRIVPFKIHHTVFRGPSSPGIGYDKLKDLIRKEYNYIYSGENTDILGFNITINNLAFSAVADLVQARDQQVNTNQNLSGIAEREIEEFETNPGAGISAQRSKLGNTGRPRKKYTRNFRGGAEPTGTARAIAEAFYRAALENSNTELVVVDLEILGDMYFLQQNELSNNFSRPADRLILEDGSMNSFDNDGFIYIRFRTPADVNVDTGLYEFPRGGNENYFSGIYRVIMIDNVFEDGVFKQVLKCNRMPNQPQDYDEAVTATKDTALGNRSTGSVENQTQVTQDGTSFKTTAITPVPDIGSRSTVVSRDDIGIATAQERFQRVNETDTNNGVVVEIVPNDSFGAQD